MPLVLTTNDVVRDHDWNDVEGVQYHYPNQYKNKVRTGEEFVYYRGVHREAGPRGTAEYFGRGRIGVITPDPATLGQSRPSWFCTIEDYVPFNPPTPAKVNGVFYENIKPNMWRNGVRDLDQATFAAIIAAAGGSVAPIAPPPPSAAGLTEAANLVIPAKKVVGGSASSGAGYRRSKRAKEIGDWAEKAALEFIRAHISCSAVVHRAGIGETPGWDIDYVDEHGVLQRVEVKGTVGGAFASVDMTIGELRAAKEHGDVYWLFLVAGCQGDHPKIQRVRNPAAKIATGDWSAKPLLYNVRFG